MTKEELRNIFKLAKSSKNDIYLKIAWCGNEDYEYRVVKNKHLISYLVLLETRVDNECYYIEEENCRIIDAGCIDFYMGE